MKRRKRRRGPSPIAKQRAKLLTGKAIVPKMPRHFPNDPHVVTFLIRESERMTEMGNKWLAAKTPNHIAAQKCLEVGWAHSLSAAWLRCKLNGEMDEPRPKGKNQK